MPFFSQTFTNTIAAKESGNAYLNPSGIEDGGSARMAILSESPLEGYEIWFTKDAGGMTKRITPDYPTPQLLTDLEKAVEGTVLDRDGKKAIKACSAFFVYHYEDEKVKLFSANQKTLLSDINRLTSDEDYANLADWDLKVTRTGKGTDTKYSAMMVPTKRTNKATQKAIYEAWDEACQAGADLEALYDGGNPFGAKDA